MDALVKEAMARVRRENKESEKLLKLTQEAAAMAAATNAANASPGETVDDEVIRPSRHTKRGLLAVQSAAKRFMQPTAGQAAGSKVKDLRKVVSAASLLSRAS